jgi:hypothetical protein
MLAGCVVQMAAADCHASGFATTVFEYVLGTDVGAGFDHTRSGRDQRGSRAAGWGAVELDCSGVGWETQAARLASQTQRGGPGTSRSHLALKLGQPRCHNRAGRFRESGRSVLGKRIDSNRATTLDLSAEAIAWPTLFFKTLFAAWATPFPRIRRNT